MDRRGQHGAGTERDGEGAGVAPEAAARLRDAIAKVASGKATREELQAAAKQLVTELRSRDQAPEQMLLQIKRILAEAGLRAGGSVLYQDVIAWSIRDYYASSE